MNYYHTSYNDYTAFKINLRRLILLGAVICDFFAFYTIADIVLSGAVYVLQMAALFILSATLRIVSINLLHSFDYVFDGIKLTVTKSNSYKSKVILTIEKGSAVEFCEETPSGIVVTNLAGNSIKKRTALYNGRCYILALDDYMTAVIENLIDKETEEEK